MPKKFRLLTAAILFISLTSFAQTKAVSGSYTYVASKDMPISVAEDVAIQKARIEALGNAFGREITSATTTQKAAQDADFSFSMFASDLVKGEWLGDIKPPVVSDPVFSGNQFSVTATVFGKAREIPIGRVTVTTDVLCNGVDEKFKSDKFANGDDLYLRFLSPVDGFLVVYLIGTNGNAYRLLPYREAPEGAYYIKAGEEYVFFSEEKVRYEDKHYLDCYSLTTDLEMEVNYIYTAFSPNRIHKGADHIVAGNIPNELSKNDFNSWTFNLQVKDPDVVVSIIPILISRRRL